MAPIRTRSIRPTSAWRTAAVGRRRPPAPAAARDRGAPARARTPEPRANSSVRPIASSCTPECTRRPASRARFPASLGSGRRGTIYATVRGIPKDHRPKIHSTNPLTRLNGEIKRHTEVVGIFPNEDAITRLVGAILLEQNDERAVQRARYRTPKTIAPLGDDPIVKLPAVAARAEPANPAAEREITSTPAPFPETRSANAAIPALCPLVIPPVVLHGRYVNLMYGRRPKEKLRCRCVF
jgi:hypothetical protein